MKKRVFLAINLPDDIRKKVEKVSVNLANKLPEKGVKIVEPKNLHITLHFLGDHTDANSDEIKKLSRNAAQFFGYFKLSLGEIDAFPHQHFPRIVVLKLKKGKEEIKELHKILAEKLKMAGIEIDCRPWEGHITLARIKFGEIVFEDFGKEKVEDAEWEMKDFSLVESDLTADGPVYNVLETFSFRR